MRNRYPSLLSPVVLLSMLAVLQPAASAQGDEPPALPELVTFDPVWKDFNLKDKMKDEIVQHMREYATKAGGFQIIDRGTRDRKIMEQRIFVMGVPDLVKAEEIARQAGWSYLLHTTFQGVPRKGVKITVVFRDLTKGAERVLTQEKMAANHLKALRDTARALVHDAVKAGAAGVQAASPQPTAAGAATP